MASNNIIDTLLTALRKIGEHHQVLGATSHADWRRRAQIIARHAVEEAEKSLRRNAQPAVEDEV